MGKRENKLEISGQYSQCPLFLSIDTYEGCSNDCRYCFVHYQHERQIRGRERRQGIHRALLTNWERVINGEKINNPLVEYLVSKKHPIQLGTKSDPFPRGIEEEVKNTRRFLEMCNRVSYPVYINTKNTGNMPLDLLSEGNYVLAVSLASHRAEDIRNLENHTSDPMERLQFKKVVAKWQPFIPQLFIPGKKTDELVSWDEIDGFLDMISAVADAISISWLNRATIKDHALLDELGPDDMEELDELELLMGVRTRAHRRGLEFYTANYRALSDSPICCGLREDEFKTATPWVWGFLIWKLFSRQQEYLIVKDLEAAFPDELRDVMFSTVNIIAFNRWARYSAKKTTILDQYINNFTMNRTTNPVNYFAGLYSRIVDNEYRIYFKDYRELVTGQSD
jgi:DNA repair photolyase